MIIKAAAGMPQRPVTAVRPEYSVASRPRLDVTTAYAAKALPDRWSYVVAEHESGVAALSAHARTRFVAMGRTNSRRISSPERRGWRRRDGRQCSPIEGEHVRIGAVIENRLERGPTLLRDADDQHVVIIAQKLQLQGRMSGAAVDVALDGRADLGYQVLRPAVRQNRHSQHMAAHQQAQNLRCDQTCAPVRLLGWQVVATQHLTDDFEGEELTDRPRQGGVSQGGADRATSDG